MRGTKAAQPGLDEALGSLREGDTFVVWKLDRLGRSLNHVVETIRQLDARKVGFKSLSEHIDTTTSAGKLIFDIFSALGQCEHSLIRERTQAGLEAARARGRKGGRQKKLNAKQASIAQALYYDKNNPIADICKTLNISRSTLYRYVEVKPHEAVE